MLRGSGRSCLVLGGALALAACGKAELAVPNDRLWPDVATGGGGGSGGAFVIGVDPALPAGDFVIRVDPAEARAVVDFGAPEPVTFRVSAELPDGSRVAIQPESVAFDRPDVAALASRAPLTLAPTGVYGGTGTLQVVAGGRTGTARLTVVVERRGGDGAIEERVRSALRARDLPEDPLVASLLYPYDATVFPLGIASPLLMWNAPSPDDVYRVVYEHATYRFEGFYRAGDPAEIRVEQRVWEELTASSQGDPLRVRVSRWDAREERALDSVAQTWRIAPESLRGAIYYWTTSGGGHLSRIQPAAGAKPAVLGGGTCMGCHAVSADGSTLVAAVDKQPALDGTTDHRAWVAFDLPGGSVRAISGFFGGNVAVNPDGRYVVFGSRRLSLGDTANGLVVADSGLEGIPLEPGMSGFMTPSFSPDGSLLAAVEGFGSGYHNLRGGSLVRIDFDPATRRFSNKQRLVSAAAFPSDRRALAYPSVSPDARHVAFHVADNPTGCDGQGCSEISTQIGAIWLSALAGGPPVRLDRLSDPRADSADADRSFEPTFNPLERGGYHWVVFTSMRDFGHRNRGPMNNLKKRLWVAAVDASFDGASDPSHPAFFLEGQEESTINMRGFWTIAACLPTGSTTTCAAGFDCCSGFCVEGRCVEPQSLACAALDAPCTRAEECCNSPQITCRAARCRPSPVR